ncbi:MAG: bifunctional metallophosphatase/5'-nucleotidase [Saprospiraceae bacterium]
MVCRNWLFFTLLLLGILSCKPKQVITYPDSKGDGKIQFTILQINDVYEIAPLENGKTGGMARVASLRKQIRESGNPSLGVLSGDFLSPSLLGTLKVNGRKVAGEQMVDCMNAAGIDLVTFGNHEFDISEQDLQLRIDQSEFKWISSNVLQNGADGLKHRFYKIANGEKNYLPDNWIWEINDADGTTAKIGFFAVTLSTFPVDFVSYEAPFLEARKAFEHLQSQCDLVLGVTHLDRAQDSILAMQIPEVPLLMGGHDHDNMKFKVGQTTVTKADANAKTAYLHTFSYDQYFGTMQLTSELIYLNEDIALDKETDAIVTKWTNVLGDKVKSVYPNPNEIIYRTNVPLDGRESSVRNKQTNLGELLAKSMIQSVSKPVKAAFFNSGGIRIDDQLSGDVTAIDIFRVLPYGGELFVVDMKGDLLIRVLEYSEKSKGTGAYLQRTGFDFKEGKWNMAGEPIQKDQTYTVALNDFLLKGFDIPFLIDDPKLISNKIVPEKGSLASDVRLGLIEFLKKGGE